MEGEEMCKKYNVAVFHRMAVLIIVMFSQVLEAAPVQEIGIYIGETEILSHAGVKRVSVGNGEYLDVKVLSDSKQILLIAKKIGVTDLRVWFKSGKKLHYLVRVNDQPLDGVLKQVREHIRHIEGVRARIVGNKVVIEGNSLRKSDIQKIDLVTKQYDNVVSYVTAGGITLHGMVFMDVKVVEVNKKELKRIGVNWADSMNGPVFSEFGDFKTNPYYRTNVSPGNDFGSIPNKIGRHNPYFGISSSITSIINLLEQNGHARMLAEPKLTCKSGGKAEFLAGGELPIPVRDSDGNVQVIFKQYGIILKVEPVSDSEGYISTRVNIEVSTIDESVKVLDIPGFLTRKTETDMNLKQGQTMVISGLLNNKSSKDVDKVPGLGSVPILGELFKSRSFQSEETELIILVTPTLIHQDHKINKNYIRKANAIIKKSDEDLRFKLMD